MENDDEWMQTGGDSPLYRYFVQFAQKNELPIIKGDILKGDYDTILKTIEAYVNKYPNKDDYTYDEGSIKFNEKYIDSTKSKTEIKRIIEKAKSKITERKNNENARKKLEEKQTKAAQNRQTAAAAKATEAAKKAPVAAAPVVPAPVATASVATTLAPVQTVDLLNEIEKLLNSPPPAPGPGPAPALVPAVPVPTLTPYAVVTINIQPKDNSPDTVPQKYTAYLATPNILLENYQIGTQTLTPVDLKKLKACKYYLYNTQNAQNTTYYYLPDTELSEPPPHILSSTADLLAQSE
jgi:hypothetical protein